MVGGPDRSGTQEEIAGIPLAYLDVLGIPVWERVWRKLQRFGVSRFTLVSDTLPEADTYLRNAVRFCEMPQVRASGEEFWRAGAKAFQQYAQDGAELVIVQRIGPYTELDYDAFMQHHLDRRCAVSMAVDVEHASLDVFVLNTSTRVDAQALFASGLQRLRRECEPFEFKGYVNRLQSPSDLRVLGMDGLMELNSIRPTGREHKPGVWVGKAARIHREARIIAPAFIGAHSKIRASALITRGTVIEQHAEVDCGTVVENSTVLPFTRIGAGLDVMHSVVGFRRLTHLLRKVQVEISDSRFIGMVPSSALSRFAGSTAAVFAILTKRGNRGSRRRSQCSSSAAASESGKKASLKLDASEKEKTDPAPKASQFSADLAVTRRYGEQ